jgi:hypothetical protein
VAGTAARGDDCRRPGFGREREQRRRGPGEGEDRGEEASGSLSPRPGAASGGTHRLAGIDGQSRARQLPACVKEEDKGIFAHTPLGFAVFQEILKTGQKQIYFAVLDYFENPETLQTLYKYYVAFFEQFINTT